jgi:hypothetical protein
MPYVPPHLRPGYVHPVKVTVDYSGKVHWPTNIDSMRENNIEQPKKLHSPRTNSHTLGIVSGKSALKMTEPITPNSKPLVRPGTVPEKFRPALRAHYKLTRKSKKSKKSKKTRKFLKSKKTK